jgi:F-type H+-transporting ATPase subunit delta
VREPTIARNYAEALFTSGERTGSTDLYANMLEAVAGAIEADDTVRDFLESPRVPKAKKEEILSRALKQYAPEQFLKFLGAVVKRGRQGIFPAIAREYLALVDKKFNRVHAGVTVAREPDLALQGIVKQRLSEVLGMEVIPHFRTDKAILGGLVVRVGDRIMDGSVRRRMVTLRRKLLGT